MTATHGFDLSLCLRCRTRPVFRASLWCAQCIRAACCEPRGVGCQHGAALK